MRKLLWVGALVILAAGVYWSVAHGTVHPSSPVGRAMVWLGMNRVAPAPVLCSLDPCISTPGCDPEPEQTIYVQAHKPAGLIMVQPDFVPMPDADGNEAYSQVVVRSEPVREVVTSEEFRIMPEVEDVIIEEKVPECKPKGQISIGLSMCSKSPCPIDLTCEFKYGDYCRMTSFSGLYNLLHGKCLSECCPVSAACQKACGKDCPAACCKEGCKCPAGCKMSPINVPVSQPEQIKEAPVEIETSTTGNKPIG